MIGPGDINHDLALALIDTWKQRGFPGNGPQHPDYLLVNKIFLREIPVLRRHFATAWQLELDELAGELDDWSQRALVQVTRAMAWEQAERLWALQDDEENLARAKLVMDRATALAGETLLTGTNALRVLWLTAWAAMTALRAAVGRRLVRRRVIAVQPAAASTNRMP